jgi:nitronate monooxygenase
MTTARSRADAFCTRFGLRLPILMAPMASACPPELAAAVANAGGMGGFGALALEPPAIAAWAQTFRGLSNGAFQINLWIPDAPPVRDRAAEANIREFLGQWGPPVAANAADGPNAEFASQCEAVLDAAPQVVSSIMGVYPAEFVAQLKARGIPWFACVTTLNEAREAQDAGADALVVQGVEAGGHRGAFDPADSARHGGTLFALLPRIADQVDLPLIATGGIADGRGIAAALTLGASAVQIGTGLLRTAESGIHPAWSDALAKTEAEDTIQTRAYSGRLARGIATAYAVAAAQGPTPAPYPVQRALTAAMRAQAQKDGDPDRMQLWAGQAAAMAKAAPVEAVMTEMWTAACALLP